MRNLVIDSQKCLHQRAPFSPTTASLNNTRIPLDGPTTPTTRRRIIRPPTPFNFTRLATPSDNESEDDSASAHDREEVYAVPPLYDFEYSGYGELEPRKRQRGTPESEAGSSNLSGVSESLDSILFSMLRISWLVRTIARSPLQRGYTSCQANLPG